MKALFSAILLAGGSGTRFGGSRNKVYESLRDKPVLAYSLEVLMRHPLVAEVILVHRERDEALLGQLLGPWMTGEKPVFLTKGGATRQESVYNGLKLAREAYILVQDGARPRLKPEYIESCYEALSDYPGCAVGVPAKDTIKLTDEGGVVTMTTVRALTWQVQTPQCFRTEVFRHAHECLKDRTDLTDDCSLLEALGEKVKLLPGDESNRKVTTRSDLELMLRENNT